MRVSLPLSFSAAVFSIAALALAGCSGKSSEAPPPADAAADTCDAAPLQKQVGKPLDVNLMQFFEAAVPSHRVRVLKPNTAMTEDMVPERANIKTDDQNVITAITCG